MPILLSIPSPVECCDKEPLSNGFFKLATPVHGPRQLLLHHLLLTLPGHLALLLPGRAWARGSYPRF